MKGPGALAGAFLIVAGLAGLGGLAGLKAGTTYALAGLKPGTTYALEPGTTYALDTTYALETTSASARHAQATAPVAPEDDPWNFEDEGEPVETWTEIVRGQAVDLVLFAAFAALALTSFFRKSVWMKYAALAASVAYLGVYKSQLLSIVNIFGVLGGNLPLFKYNLGWYAFAMFSGVTTVLFGRLYCGRVCAYGALTQLLDPIVPARYRFDVPLRVERHASKIKYGILAAVLVYFLATRDMSIYRYVEPFWMFTGHETAAMWTALGVLLIATVFVRNLYCRFLCPLGAALGLLSKFTIFGIKRWSECKSCKLCEKTCQWGAIEGPKIIMTECVRCDDCERLYMDQQKCPHWIIIRRKTKVGSR
jgi:polyferredoxin